MPFTLSHAAAVLPLVRDRGPLVASALVAGSLAPDVPFFVESLLPGSYRHGHTAHRAWAVPTVDVAIAAGLVGLWHGLLREPLVALLPDDAADRAEALTARPAPPPVARRTDGRAGPADRPARRAARGAAWFAASAATGAATHLAWDSFTHHGRAGVRALPVLQRRVAGVPWHDVLQYGTSAAGLGVLAVAGARRLGRAEPARRRLRLERRSRRRAVAGIGAAAALGAAHRVVRLVHERGSGSGMPAAGALGPARSGPLTPHQLVAAACFGGGAGASVGAVAHAVLAHASAAAARAAPAASSGRPVLGGAPHRGTVRNTAVAHRG